MAMIDVLQKGMRFTNSDPAAQEMLADFTDHKVGMKLDGEEMTIIIKDGKVMLESGTREDCHAAMGMTTRICAGNRQQLRSHGNTGEGGNY